jgi:glycerol-3-phosphate dehydrogenase
METSIEEGYKIRPEDVQFLLKHANKNLKYSLAESKIISLRCGLRPLVVRKSFEANCYPLDISRKHKIVEDPDRPWISIYGGKISGCISMANSISKKILRKIPPGLKKNHYLGNRTRAISWTSFPGLQDKVPTILWCVSNEFCCTIEDYLRRRTNISQWSPREGLGFQNENLEYLKILSSHLPGHSGKSNDSHLHAYRKNVQGRFDDIIEQIY